VVTADGRTLEAELVGRDPGADIAVLKVADAKIPAAKWGELDGLKVGHMVVTLGRPEVVAGHTSDDPVASVRLSVCVPTYRRPELVGRAIASIVAAASDAVDRISCRVR
jgi:S1-C subfamily serine protease